MSPSAKPPGRRAPARGAYDSTTRAEHYTRRTPRLPDDWRQRLPDPASYYAAALERLSRPNAAGWAQARCPFHDDRTASLSVQLVDARGGFRCFGCAAKGDLVAYHMLRTGLPFADAVRDLIGAGR